VIAPAMNVRMWDHPARTQRNLAVLRGDGIQLVGPNDGDMPAGIRPGRMSERLGDLRQ